MHAEYTWRGLEPYGNPNDTAAILLPHLKISQAIVAGSPGGCGPQIVPVKFLTASFFERRAHRYPTQRDQDFHDRILREQFQSFISSGGGSQFAFIGGSQGGLSAMVVHRCDFGAQIEIRIDQHLAAVERRKGEAKLKAELSAGRRGVAYYVIAIVAVCALAYFDHLGK